MWNDCLSHTQGVLPNSFSFLLEIAWVCRMSFHLPLQIQSSPFFTMFCAQEAVLCKRHQSILIPLASNWIPQIGITGWRQQQKNEARTSVSWTPFGNVSFHELDIFKKMFSPTGKHLSFTIYYISSVIQARIQKLGTKFQLLLNPMVLDYLLMVLESTLPKPYV